MTSTHVAQRLQTHFNRQDMATLESQWITSISSTRSNDWAMRCVAVNCHHNNEFKVSYMGLRQIVSEMEPSQTKTNTESVWIVKKIGVWRDLQLQAWFRVDQSRFSQESIVVCEIYPCPLVSIQMTPDTTHMLYGIHSGKQPHNYGKIHHLE